MNNKCIRMESQNLEKYKLNLGLKTTKLLTSSFAFIETNRNREFGALHSIHPNYGPNGPKCDLQISVAD